MAAPTTVQAVASMSQVPSYPEPGAHRWRASTSVRPARSDDAEDSPGRLVAADGDHGTLRVAASLGTDRAAVVDSA